MTRRRRRGWLMPVVLGAIACVGCGAVDDRAASAAATVEAFIAALAADDGSAAW